MKLSNIALVMSALGAFGAPSYHDIKDRGYGNGFNFSGRYPQKENKLSQKAKRKRTRQKGGRK